MTQNPFSFNYTTLLQTSTYKNKKFDIKNAGFMRPAITFLNIQLSNSRATADQIDNKLAKRLYKYMQMYGRVRKDVKEEAKEEA